jgi:hypothetical protein
MKGSWVFDNMSTTFFSGSLWFLYAPSLSLYYFFPTYSPSFHLYHTYTLGNKGNHHHITSSSK